MAGDWVKVYRKMLSSEVFADPDPALLKLWMYCLLKANWKPKMFSGELIPVGSFAFVSRNLASVLGVTKSKLWRDINKLEIGTQIETQTNRKFTVVSICNWETYQGLEDDDRNANRDTNRDKNETQIGTKSVQKRTTNKEVKKERREEVKKQAAAQPVEIPQNLNQPDFIAALADFRQMRKEIKKPITPAAEKKLFARLEKWGVEKSIVALDRSTESQWQGVFEPKPEDMPAVAVSRVPTDQDLADWTPD
jgi:biotin operon repressor